MKNFLGSLYEVRIFHNQEIMSEYVRYFDIYLDPLFKDAAHILVYAKFPPTDDERFNKTTSIKLMGLVFEHMVTIRDLVTAKLRSLHAKNVFLMQELNYTGVVSNHIPKKQYFAQRGKIHRYPEDKKHFSKL